MPQSRRSKVSPFRRDSCVNSWLPSRCWQIPWPSALTSKADSSSQKLSALARACQTSGSVCTGWIPNWRPLQWPSESLTLIGLSRLTPSGGLIVKIASDCFHRARATENSINPKSLPPALVISLKGLARECSRGTETFITQTFRIFGCCGTPTMMAWPIPSKASAMGMACATDS